RQNRAEAELQSTELVLVRIPLVARQEAEEAFVTKRGPRLVQGRVRDEREHREHDEPGAERKRLEDAIRPDAAGLRTCLTVCECRRRQERHVWTLGRWNLQLTQLRLGLRAQRLGE